MKTILIIFICLTFTDLKAQSFDDYFTNATLRLDYIFAGDNKTQHIFFHQAHRTPGWAGRRARLSEKYIDGNGQITLRDLDNNQVIYISTFSALFLEWQAEEEATRVKKSFENSYIVPFPKKPVEVTISLKNHHGQITSELTHVINPNDILIEKKEKNLYDYRHIHEGGDMISCVDIAIISEGYTREDMNKFHNDCKRASDALFSHEPFTSMKDKFNIIAVDCPSEESGPCIPRRNQWKSTSVGTHYDTFYTDRYLMTSNMWRVYDVLTCIPFEHIIIMVNSSQYGGGGIYNQINVTTSDHSTFKEVLVHEFGHGYGGLGDEYDYGDQVENMYPSDTEPWEPNLTTLHDFSSKWADLVPKGTPIPTPKVTYSPSDDMTLIEFKKKLTQTVGVFEGGGYQSKGVYRPAQECRMKVNEVDYFCPVCTRALIGITEFYTSH